MTRYDKELRKHGVKLEADYPWLPYGNPALESVITRVTDEGLQVEECYVVGCFTRTYNRGLQVIREEFA